MKLLEVIHVFPMKTNSFYLIFQQKNYWTRNLGYVSTIWLPNVKAIGELSNVFWYLIEN